MAHLREWILRLLSVWRPRRDDRDLEDELRSRLLIAADAKVRAGDQPAAVARRSAALRAGALGPSLDAVRDQRGLPWLEQLGRDLRYALRRARRSAGFTATLVLTLTFVIGANIAIFALIDAVMWRTLPVASPATLVTVGDASRPTRLAEGGPLLTTLSYPLYMRLRDRNDVMTLAATGRAGRVEMRADGGATEDVQGRLVSANYFDVLGVPAQIGRTLSTDDDREGAGPVVVLSDDYWKKRFGRDPSVVGRRLTLNDTAFTVVGVGPRSFTGEVVGSPADMWMPLAMQPRLDSGRSRLDRWDSNWLVGLGRLQRGSSIDRARVEMTRVAHQAFDDYPSVTDDLRRETVMVESGAHGLSRTRVAFAPLLATLMGAVVIVWLIACANITNLLLARAASTQREMAIRMALGAARQQLIRQVLVEGLLVSALGGVTGLLAGRLASIVVMQLMSSGGANAIPFDVAVPLDARLVVFAVAMSLSTAALFCAAPAWRSTSVELSSSLRAGTRGHTGVSTLGKVFVAAQIALSVPLLIAAGLFGRSLANQEDLDVGYARNQLALVDADVTHGREVPAYQLVALAGPLSDRLARLPGVSGVTLSQNGLFGGIDSGADALDIEGFTPTQRADRSSQFDEVGPRYFQMTGIPLVMGRDFDERDRLGAPDVAVINETMARFYFGGRNPLGRVIKNGGDRYTIVGVAKDSKQRDLKEQTERRFYLPLLQDRDAASRATFVVRTSDDAASRLPALQSACREIDPSMRVRTTAVGVLMRQSTGDTRALAYLVSTFALAAATLAAIGLFGVMSYAAARRTREIGVRIALGARRMDILRMVLRDAWRVAGIGIAIGVPIGLMATRIVRASLVGVSSNDPVTVIAVTGGIVIVATVASVIPAVRAARVDPVAALQVE